MTNKQIHGNQIMQTSVWQFYGPSTEVWQKHRTGAQIPMQFTSWLSKNNVKTFSQETYFKKLVCELTRQVSELQ